MWSLAKFSQKNLRGGGWRHQKKLNLFATGFNTFLIQCVWRAGFEWTCFQIPEQCWFVFPPEPNAWRNLIVEYYSVQRVYRWETEVCGWEDKKGEPSMTSMHTAQHVLHVFRVFDSRVVLQLPRTSAIASKWPLPLHLWMGQTNIWPRMKLPTRVWPLQMSAWYFGTGFLSVCIPKGQCLLGFF